jgi:hypothetical protein
MLNLSPLTQKLIDTYKQIETSKAADQSAKLEVSQTVSFLGSVYEKMRNAVEYRESHLIRKATIERILRRRILLNQRAEDFSESLVRELLWGKYLKNDTVSQNTVKETTSATVRYLNLRRQVIIQLENTDQIGEVSDWIIELLACKLELILAPSPRSDAFVRYIFEWIRPIIELKDENRQTSDAIIYLAVQKAFNKADEQLLRCHFITLYGEENLFTDFWKTYKITNTHVRNPLINKVSKFLKKQNAPFLILESLFNEKSEKSIKEILQDTKELTSKISQICKLKYSQVNKRLHRAAFRSIVYIFLTKMLLAFLLEIPADRFLEGEIDLVPLAINISFPPFLMFIIALLISPPGSKNTKRITEYIKQILSKEHSDSQKRIFEKKAKVGKPLLTFVFTAIYGITFLLIFGLIFFGLTKVGFNFASQLIFIFFLTVVSFFAYRIRQIPREYRLKEKDGILTPIIDFLMLPILSVGKRLSETMGKINIITFVFDFILEAPFKAIFEVFEEWIGFLRKKREEIA